MLGEIGDGEAVELLIPGLEDTSPAVRRSAMGGLRRIVNRLGGATAETAVEPLASALTDEDFTVRGHAVAILTQIGAPAVGPQATRNKKCPDYASASPWKGLAERLDG